jgi:uncharacterized protein (DUF2147 family)
MKRIVFSIFLTAIIIGAYAQDAQKITGIWWNNEKTSKIEVKEVNGQLVGTIVHIVPEKYINGEPEKDNMNPDEKLRSRSRLGIQILFGLKYNASDKEWQNGKIYDPKNGKTYDCYAWFDNDTNVLNLKGYVAGIKLLGRSTTWTRTTK